MIITYHESTKTPGYYVAAVDGVVVAFWAINGWVDRGLYRPLRSHFNKVEWTKLKYEFSVPKDQLHEFNFVKEHGREYVENE